MIRKLVGFFILFSLVVAADPTIAGYPTGQDILVACTGESGDQFKVLTDPVHCIGYIDGVVDAHGLFSSANPACKYFCAPAGGLSAGDAMDVVILFIQNVPEARSMTGRLAIIKALQEKYPCR